MKPGASLLERFNGWFAAPIEKLEELPEGDGGFLALSTALFLCERYYRTLTKTQENSNDNESFKIAAADDLVLSLEDFKIFWMVYRNGIQHQGMPRTHKDKNNVNYSWHTKAEFGGIPEFHDIDAHSREIRLNPWKFAELMVSKFRNNPAVLEDAVSHAFGEVK